MKSSLPAARGNSASCPATVIFLSTLRIGELRYMSEDQTNHMSILWGYAEVTPTKSLSWLKSPKRPRTSMSAVRSSR